MIDLSRVAVSPYLNAQTLRVFRSYGSFVAGRWTEVEQIPPSFDVAGVAYPSSEKELAQVPEGDRIKGGITFVTVEKLNTTAVRPPAGISDKIEWNGKLYKILSIFTYSDYGYYASMAERVEGD